MVNVPSAGPRLTAPSAQLHQLNFLRRRGPLGHGLVAPPLPLALKLITPLSNSPPPIPSQACGSGITLTGHPGFPEGQLRTSLDGPLRSFLSLVSAQRPTQSLLLDSLLLAALPLNPYVMVEVLRYALVEV